MSETQIVAPATVDLTVDVTDAARIDQVATNKVTVYLPDVADLPEKPIVCFAFPGAGYSRHYYTVDLAGDGVGQADFHSRRGWIFVASDQLGFGEATTPDGDELTYENVAESNAATVAAVLQQLADGTLLDGYPKVLDPVRLGLGQSMGGCFLIVAQAHFRPFDAIGILGFSAIHTDVPTRPGAPAAVWPWVLRGAGQERHKALNQRAIDAAAGHVLDGQASAREVAAADAEHPMQWAFHWEDETGEKVRLDIEAMSAQPGDPLPMWRSPNTPSCALAMVAPGTVATEAAAIDVPVLVAIGERDVVLNPALEPTAYRSSRDLTMYTCPRMAHMHNFATTHQQLWTRIHSWGEGVRLTALLDDASGMAGAPADQGPVVDRPEHSPR